MRLFALHAFALRLPLLAFALSAGPATAALATSAWQCGPEGRVYSDTPCTGGREVTLPAPRPAEDVRDAQRRAAREAALAERLRRERQARESAALATNAQPINLGPVRRTTQARVEPAPARPAPPQASRPKLSKAKPPRPQESAPGEDGRTWRATAPASPRTPG